MLHDKPLTEDDKDRIEAAQALGAVLEPLRRRFKVKHSRLWLLMLVSPPTVNPTKDCNELVSKVSAIASVPSVGACGIKASREAPNEALAKWRRLSADGGPRGQ